MVVVRDADTQDVPAICAFGAAHVPPHYAPLIGVEAADAQVAHWWNQEQISAAVAAGLVVVAAAGDQVVGVAQRREGFTVERTAPSADGDPALDVVWRVRQPT